MPMLTKSSLLAEVGTESAEAGCARTCSRRTAPRPRPGRSSTALDPGIMGQERLETRRLAGDELENPPFGDVSQSGQGEGGPVEGEGERLAVEIPPE